MKTYDEKCPICGELNCDLYLEDTEGWMECKKCHSVVQILKYRNAVKTPVYDGKDIVRLLESKGERNSLSNLR